MPLPSVASIAASPAKRRELHSSNERFEGSDSIYANGGDGPAPTHYDVSAAVDSSASRVVGGAAFEKQSWLRFNGHNSIYNAEDTPAPNAYDTTNTIDTSAVSTQVSH